MAVSCAAGGSRGVLTARGSSWAAPPAADVAGGRCSPPSGRNTHTAEGSPGRRAPRTLSPAGPAPRSQGRHSQGRRSQGRRSQGRRPQDPRRHPVTLSGRGAECPGSPPLSHRHCRCRRPPTRHRTEAAAADWAPHCRRSAAAAAAPPAVASS